MNELPFSSKLVSKCERGSASVVYNCSVHVGITMECNSVDKPTADESDRSLNIRLIH